MNRSPDKIIALIFYCVRLLIVVFSPSGKSFSNEGDAMQEGLDKIFQVILMAIIMVLLTVSGYDKLPLAGRLK